MLNAIIAPKYAARVSIPGLLGVAVLILAGLLAGLLAACGQDQVKAYEMVEPAAIKAGSAIPAPTGEVILTLSGDIDVKNVGETLQFDMATLEDLGLVKYTVDDPWFNNTNTYTGVLMSDLRKFAGMSSSAQSIHMVGLDDYSVEISVTDIEKWPILLATRTNGAYMDVDFAGPTRIIFPYQSYPIDPVTYNDYWIWNLVAMEIS